MDGWIMLMGLMHAMALLELGILAGYKITEVLLCMSLSGPHAFIRCSTRNTIYPFFLSASSGTYNPLVPENLPSLIPSELHQKQSGDIRYPHMCHLALLRPKKTPAMIPLAPMQNQGGKYARKDTGIHTRSLAIAHELFSQ